MKTLTAAIQFGSSRICAAAAWRDEQGHYEVAAIESVPTSGCINHGRVSNIEDTAVRIKSLMSKLSNRVKNQGGRELNAAYVGVCGMSMCSMKHQPSEVLTEGMEVTTDVLTRLHEQSLHMSIPGYDILGLDADGHHMVGQEVVGDHQLIIAENRLKSGFKQAMDRAGVRIAGIISTPLQLSDLLNEDEKRQNNVIIDLGAQLTTVLIYKGSALVHLAVIPLGGDVVTHDLANAARVRVEDAELAKIGFSDASVFSMEKDDMTSSYGLPITNQTFNNIVACRYEEIAENVLNQIRLVGFEAGNMPDSCILTGGASMQKGLISLFGRRLGISKISTRSCTSIRFGQSERKPHLASIMTMLNACTDSCEVKTQTIYEPSPTSKEGPQVIIRQTPPPPAKRAENTIPQKRKNGIKNFLGDLFSGLDE